MTNCPNCGLVRGFHNSILQGCTCQWQMMDTRVTFREIRDEAELKAAVAAEREACAKVCDEMEASAALSDIEKYRARFIADAIRARGEKE